MDQYVAVDLLKGRKISEIMLENKIGYKRVKKLANELLGGCIILLGKKQRPYHSDEVRNRIMKIVNEHEVLNLSANQIRKIFLLRSMYDRKLSDAFIRKLLK